MQATILLPGRDQTEMHGSGARAIEKYNPETIDRHQKGAGAMQSPQGWRPYGSVRAQRRNHERSRCPTKSPGSGLPPASRVYPTCAQKNRSRADPRSEHTSSVSISRMHRFARQGQALADRNLSMRRVGCVVMGSLPIALRRTWERAELVLSCSPLHTG
jgi:hypothetical protein